MLADPDRHLAIVLSWLASLDPWASWAGVKSYYMCLLARGQEILSPRYDYTLCL